jgi:hypothetical protein
MEVSLSGYPRLLLRFSLKRANFLDLPISKDFPVSEVKHVQTTGNNSTGELLIEKLAVNAEFLPDFLQDAGFFLQKAGCHMYTSLGRAAIVFEYGKKEKRVRGINLIRQTETLLLGEAVWGVRIYKNPDRESFPCSINFACRQPYFDSSGKPLSIKPEFILQRKEDSIILEPTLINQNSAV